MNHTTNPQDACPNCSHPHHLPGTECQTPVHHGPNRWHLCLCLARPGAALSCPPQMTCQGGTLGYADVWYLQHGHTLLGEDGTIAPAVFETGVASVGFPSGPDISPSPSAVVSADRATLRDRISDTVMPFLLNFSDEESARINAAEVADALLAVLPASEAVCICGHSKQQHFEDACITEITGCNCGDYLEPQDAAEVIDRWRQAALQARATDRATLLREAATRLWHQTSGLTEYGRGARWAVAEMRAMADCPACGVGVEHDVHGADGPNGVAAEEQPTETQDGAEAHPPEHTWKVESPRRDNWASWGTTYDEHDWARESYEHITGNAPARPFRLVRATTTYTVEAEYTPPAVAEQPDTQTRETFVPPAHYRGRDGTAYCVHATPVGPDSCRHCRELAE